MSQISDSALVNLFSQGERGVWYDPTDLSSLFQDANGTIPVTGDNQPVGFIKDKSVEVREADRSVNDKSIRVFGVLNKTPVAPGADLMAYSGFSASNYLEQPYNSDLDFGTGDFCVMGWVNTIDNSATLISRGGGTGPGFSIYQYSGGVEFNVTGSTSLSITESINQKWTLLTACRRKGVLELYYNGTLKGSKVNTNNLDNTEASLRLGLSYSGTYPFDSGSLALWRISASAPTAEQIAKIYREEKALFQENAKCTLKGTSDAVTALAYDEDTELLHVGTSWGRSDFKGLRRINENEGGITTAISAVNGLIVEE